MSKGVKKTRRTFIKSAAASAAGLALATPGRGYARVLRSVSPNEKVVVGIMGTGGRGQRVAQNFGFLPGAEVAYVSDVDERLMAQAAAEVGKAQQKTPKEAVDFRRILDDPSVDALVIVTPDHWHAPASILAMQAGKHVYVEKPCSHNPREGELLVEAQKKYGKVVQMGNQRRSRPKQVAAIEQVQSGAIGPVHYARAWYSNTRGPIGTGKVSEVPSHLDWELWQGPAPRTAYRDNVHPYNWHWFWRWGTGEAGNNGVHVVDLARWGLGVDYPTRVVSLGGRYFWEDDQETPDTQVLAFNFPGEKTIMFEALSANRYGPGGSSNGVSFHGEEGTLVISRDGFEVFNRDGDIIEEVTDDEDAAEVDVTGPGYASDQPHLSNFVNAITQGVPLNSPIDEGRKSTLLCHLGNIAYRTGATLEVDPSTGRIADDPEAMALWGREYAPGWEPEV